MLRTIAALFLLANLVGCSETCTNEISQSVASPSGEFVAYVFSRNCGATTGFNTQISILPAQNPLPDSAGNTYIFNGQLPAKVLWQSDTQISINVTGGSGSIKRQEQVGDATINHTF